jgi:hypothetical protein
MITNLKYAAFYGLLMLTSFFCGCADSDAPPIERPMEEVEAELAPAE